MPTMDLKASEKKLRVPKFGDFLNAFLCGRK
jgi:hypothetical protein